MGHQTIRHTIKRNGVYYVRFRLPDNKFFRKSLETDSHTQAQLLMSFASPVIPLVQRGTIQPDHFGKRLSEYGTSLKQQNEQWLAHQFLSEERRTLQPIVVQEYRELVAPSEDEEEQTEAQSKDVLTLAGAWNMYKKEKAQNWMKAISQANERFMEVVENLPKRVVQPYRSMTVQQLIECDDVPPEDLVVAESIHKHLKIYKSLFKTFLTDNKDILEKSPTDGVVAAPSKARFGAYSAAEMRKFVGWALKQPDGWQKWITLLLAYTGARRGRSSSWRNHKSNLMKLASGTIS